MNTEQIADSGNLQNFIIKDNKDLPFLNKGKDDTVIMERKETKVEPL